MKSLATFLFCAIAASFSSPGQAISSLRCESDLAIVNRDSKASILRKCGEPFYTESFCVPIASDSDTPVYLVPNMPFYPLVACRLFEDWYYNPGSGELVAIMRFEGGANVLRSIRFGDRVP